MDATGAGLQGPDNREAALGPLGAAAWRGSTLSETWELSVPVTWTVYCGRLRDAMPEGHHEISSDGAHQAFSRASTGDAFSVSLDLVSPGPPLRVRVTFTAAPD